MPAIRLQRLEWAAAALALLLCYSFSDGPWILFALLVLAPDLAMLGYLFGPRVGAVAYNAAHMLVGPALAAVVGLATGNETATWIAIIWLFHIAVDRALGYGLKLSTGFRDTHLGRIGRD